MKRLTALLLFFAILLPFAVTFCILQHEKKQLKRSVKHQIINEIEMNELVYLQFSKNEVDQKLDWEHSKEFEYQGEMYDVVKTVETVDSIAYYCWWDNKETALNKKLAETLSGLLPLNTEKNKSQKLLSNFSKSLFCNSILTLQLDKFTYLKTNQHIKYTFSKLDYFTGVATPPPQA